MDQQAETAQEQEPHTPKISEGAIYFLVVGAVIADLTNWIPIWNIISAIITFFIFQLYFRSKGLPTAANIIAQLAELIPIVSILPLVTVGVLIVIWIDRHPSSTLAKTAALTSRAKRPAA